MTTEGIEGTGPIVADLLTDERTSLTQWTQPMLSTALALHDLGVDYDDFIARVRARDAMGRATYGHPLRPDTLRQDGTPYDWREKAIDELVDALLYLRAAMEVER